MPPKEEFDFVSMVADRLANYFAEPLYNLKKEKNDYTLIGTLEEIVEWAQELFDQYYDKLENWEMFKYSSENIFKANTINDFVIAFGKMKFEKVPTKNIDFSPGLC